MGATEDSLREIGAKLNEAVVTLSKSRTEVTGLVTTVDRLTNTVARLTEQLNNLPTLSEEAKQLITDLGVQATELVNSSKTLDELIPDAPPPVEEQPKEPSEP